MTCVLLWLLGLGGCCLLISLFVVIGVRWLGFEARFR